MCALRRSGVGCGRSGCTSGGRRTHPRATRGLCKHLHGSPAPCAGPVGRLQPTCAQVEVGFLLPVPSRRLLYRTGCLGSPIYGGHAVVLRACGLPFRWPFKLCSFAIHPSLAGLTLSSAIIAFSLQEPFNVRALQHCRAGLGFVTRLKGRLKQSKGGKKKEGKRKQGMKQNTMPLPGFCPLGPAEPTAVTVNRPLVAALFLASLPLSPCLRGPQWHPVSLDSWGGGQFPGHYALPVTKSQDPGSHWPGTPGSYPQLLRSSNSDSAGRWFPVTALTGYYRFG